MIMRKIKIYIILLVLSLVVLLSACTTIDISAGIDADFTAYLSYYIELDISDVDPRYHSALTRALNQIGWYYQEELDFTAELNITVEPYSLRMTRRLQNNSLEQAYRSLEFLLTNEDITPFMTVDMAYQSSERQNRYIFSASTDIPHIMSLSNAEELSPALQEQLIKGIEASKGSITISMPEGELVSSSHPVNSQSDRSVMVVPLSFTEQTNLQLTGTISLLRDGTPGGPLHEIIQELYRIRSFAIVICAAVLGLLFIIILIVILKKKKTDG